MGYRSEVYIAVPKKDEAELDAIMNEHSLKDAFSKKEHTHCDVEYIVYEGCHLKWYPNYDDVSAVDSFIIDKPYDCVEDNGDGRMMVCVGEDNEIHSHVGDYYEIFNVYTTVELQ